MWTRPCVVFGCFLSCLLAGVVPALAEQPRLVLDADTANELDDLYAIHRMLRQDKYEVVALNSAQWWHYLSSPRGGTTVDESHQLNEDLVRLLDCPDLPLFKGSAEPLGKPWGGEDPKDSAAARAIIRLARETPPDEKLVVVCIGASTNLASALVMAPDIAPRIRAYLLGFQYDVDRAVWNKSEFNIRRDLNAADLLLNNEALELWVMPANVAKPLTFARDPAWEKHWRMGELGVYLTERWKTAAGSNETWVMWDLALVEAMLSPALATAELRDTPPENTPRKVHVYTSIDSPAMEAAYWRIALPER